MTNIHQQYQALQRLPFAQIATKLLLPLLFDLQGNLCESIARQVDEAGVVVQGKKIDELGSAWRFAGSGEFGLGGQGIDAARLAGIGSPGKCDLGTFVGWTLLEFACAGEEAGGLEMGQGRSTTLDKEP